MNPELILGGFVGLMVLTVALASVSALRLEDEKKKNGALAAPLETRLKAAKSALEIAFAVGGALVVSRLFHFALPMPALIAAAIIGLYSFVTSVICFVEGWSASRTAPPEWASTPFDDLSAFDVFISYKSDDVEVVRAVVDRLLAAGVRVWFAEHIVLIQDRAGFRAAIRDGVRRSRTAVIFSNDRYAGSPHCRRELALIFGEGGPGAERSCEIRMPAGPGTHTFHPAVARTPRLEYSARDSSIGEVVEFIRTKLGLPVPPADALSNRGMNAILDADAARHWVRDRRVGWAIDVGGWTRDTKAPVGAGGVAFERQLHGRRIRMNLHVGPGTVAPRPVASTMSDRDVFDRSIAFAGEFLRTNGRRPAGVHLFLHKGFSHMVVAYWVGQCWARRYSIVLPDPATGRAMEFAFAFGFFGPFTEYCGAIPAMDRLVQSLEWPAPGV